MAKTNRTGKLSAKTLSRLLGKYAPHNDPSVLVGPGVGLDAAVIAVEKGTLVLASDPVTYAVDRIGQYAVHINANDIFASGAEPRWMLADLLLPPGGEKLAEPILADIHAACDELGGVQLIGGHTEMTPGLDKPIVVGVMIGQAPDDRILSADRTGPGDVLIVTKGAAIEGTAILAREFGEALGDLPVATVRRARKLLDSPGISIAAEARIARKCGARAMHDPTEGGILNGLWEMAVAADLELHIEADNIPVLPEAKCVCQRFDIDPLRLLASGSLLIACEADKAQSLLAELAKSDIPANVIGHACPGPPAVHLGKRKAIRDSIADDILKVMGDK